MVESGDFLDRVRARLEHMDEVATEATRALGLPMSAEATVLAVMAGQHPSDLAAATKAHIFYRVQTTLRAIGTMQPLLVELNQRERSLRELALPALMAWPNRAASSAVGMSGSQDTLLAIVSLVSWVVTNEPVDRQTIVDQALQRGIQAGLSHRLARHLLQPSGP